MTLCVNSLVGKPASSCSRSTNKSDQSSLPNTPSHTSKRRLFTSLLASTVILATETSLVPSIQPTNLFTATTTKPPLLLFNTLQESQSASAADLTPYQRGKQLDYGLVNGRIRACDGVAQPSCVSTSSLSNLYTPPWAVASDQLTPIAALEEFDTALKAVSPNVEVLEDSSTPDGVYRRYKVPSQLEYDVVEVLVEKQAPPYDADLLITYRSQASSVKYLWPITQPISDLGTQRKRMSALRAALQWRIIGCDQLECYQE